MRWGCGQYVISGKGGSEINGTHTTERSEWAWGRVLKADLLIAGDKDGVRLPHRPSASESQHSLNLIRIQRAADSLGTKCWKSLMSNPSRSPFPVRTRQMAPPHYASQQNNH